MIEVNTEWSDDPKILIRHRVIAWDNIIRSENKYLLEKLLPKTRVDDLLEILGKVSRKENLKNLIEELQKIVNK